MKPLPKLDDEAAMLLRGRRSAVASARNEAAEELRDACTQVQGADWQDLYAAACRADEACERLKTLAAMWEAIA